MMKISQWFAAPNFIRHAADNIYINRIYMVKLKQIYDDRIRMEKIKLCVVANYEVETGDFFR